ncbi:MAG: hypothetical protein IJM96_08205 [Clostridia bacterium]|nr:hypothetical protein [Clostridia bacterium]
MKYCEKCNILAGGDICPACGGELRAPAMNDYVLYAVREQMWAEMFIDALRDNGIEAISKPVMGAGLTSRLGIMTEQLRIYVPYGAIEMAGEIADLMFGEIEEEM